MISRNALIAGTSALIVALLGVAAVQQWLVDVALARDMPASALAIDPVRADAMTALADQRLRDGDDAAIVALSRQALARAPLDVAAMRNLTIASARQGEEQTAGSALRLAAAMGWRDTATQLLELSAAYRVGNLVVAMERLDALARRRKDLPREFAAMRVIAGRPGGAELVAERLAAAPPWRLDFFGDARNLKPTEVDAQERLYAALARSAEPPSADEVAPFVAAMIDRGEFARARRAWSAWSGEAGDPRAGPLGGTFARLATPGTPTFGWVAYSTPGVTAEAVTAGDGGAPMLQVTSDGRASGDVVGQMLVLAPGTHHLGYKVENAGRAAEDAFRWSVECLPDHGRLPSIPGAAEDSYRRIAFTVPAGCRAQRLVLGARGVDAGGSVTARFGSVRIN